MTLAWQQAHVLSPTLSVGMKTCFFFFFEVAPSSLESLLRGWLTGKGEGAWRSNEGLLVAR